MQTNTKKILLEWEDEVVSSLVEGFRHLFESSSQVLLEFADAAENNRLQRLFFDAQREFYLKEEAMVGEFERSLRDSMLSLAAQPGSTTTLGADTLSLVDVEDYERSLALETIAKRTVNRQMRELHGLAQRLSALLGGRPISIDQVPASPMQIIRVFDPASRKLDVEKEVRLVFYTLFDRYVMSRLGELYTSFNKRLADLGILPNLKFDYQRFGPGSGAAQGRDQGAPAGPTADNTENAGGEAVAGASAETPVQRLRPATPTATETLSAISSLLMEKRQQEAAQPLHTSVPITPTAANVGEAIADALVLREAPHPVPIPSGVGGSKVVPSIRLC